MGCAVGVQGLFCRCPRCMRGRTQAGFTLEEVDMACTIAIAIAFVEERKFEAAEGAIFDSSDIMPDTAAWT
eukprot:NODE_19348_length_847_cov_4.431944.p5 GENE.NODE_19348_length_847_cov_4.431944~~NODE_19348_length_847_cov_4.431944.p5  ORF type:complete len:71 (+),score=14.55 NODE_19348_length_847_cov_4.431944:264-476(+)